MAADHDPDGAPGDPPAPSPVLGETPAGEATAPGARRSASGSGPPRRPTDMSPAELQFTPQPATRWFSPAVLAQSGLKVGVTAVFGSFLDKRELQSSRPRVVDLLDPDDPPDEAWIDYVADTGDGFAATSTVAHAVGRPALAVDGHDRPLPRGEILVLGGDEVYPVASSEGYENRLEGPWRAALPWTPPPDPHDPAHPRVYAVPGNHDWYDGLTGFLRMFGQGRWVGGWRTRQTRSYFAAQLPHRWWLWGVDVQSEALIDEPQLAYFERVADEHCAPGDRIVLATPVPTWARLGREPRAFRNLAYFEKAVLAPRRLDLRLTVAGDLHHYSRYEQCTPGGGPPAHKITAGGGGAFLHPTHDLPPVAEVAVDPDDPDEVSAYALQPTRYPSPGRSRLLSLLAVTLPVRNPSFMTVPGLAAVTLLWSVQFGLRSLEQRGASFAEAAVGWGFLDTLGGVFRNSVSLVMVLVLYGGLCGFARTPPWVRDDQRARRYALKALMAAVHVAAQLAAMAGVGLAAVAVADAVADGGWPFATVAVLATAGLGAVAGSLVVGAYLAVAIGTPGVNAHANEAFAAARLTGYRNFLRLHVHAGGLTVYAVGIDRTVRQGRWRVSEGDGDPSAAWVRPLDPVRPHLIERVEIAARPLAPAGAAPRETSP